MDKMLADPFGNDHCTDQKVGVIANQAPKKRQSNAPANRNIGRQKLLKTYSAKPLPPGVGLTNIIIHMTNCFPKTMKCSNKPKWVKPRKEMIKVLTTQ